MKTSQFMRRDFDAMLAAKALASPDFRARLISEPGKIYEAELGKPIPPETKIVVVEESGDTFYVVLPYLPDHLKSDPEKIGAVARRELTFRSPCWGIGDGPE